MQEVIRNGLCYSQFWRVGAPMAEVGRRVEWVPGSVGFDPGDGRPRNGSRPLLQSLLRHAAMDSVRLPIGKRAAATPRGVSPRRAEAPYRLTRGE